MGWVIEIKGRMADLELLTGESRDNDLKVIKKGEKYFLESDQIIDESSPEHVRGFRDTYSMRLNSILELCVNDTKGITIEFHYQNEKGEKYNYSWLEGSVPSISGNLSVIGDEKPHIPIMSILAVAEKNHEVEKVLRIINQSGLSWDSLYKIFEIIRKDLQGENELKEKSYVRSSELSRFKNTCNSPEVLGIKARHGVQTKKPPQRPMALGDAQEFIRIMAMGWIEEKFQ